MCVVRVGVDKGGEGCVGGLLVKAKGEIDDLVLVVFLINKVRYVAS